MTDNVISTGRTFRHHVFDAEALARLKNEQQLTLSVIIPARNEEATVGTVTSTLRGELVEDIQLIDELLVVDGASTDDTAAVAEAAGAQVVEQDDILPDMGPGTGKGEALWKGLAASVGDLVVFVDADIHDIDGRFVTGLVGPLLTDRKLQFVKAAYDRPLKVSEDDIRNTGGGRVTELLARPLLSAFWPQLSWLAQPLSGEYAGRRDMFESLPFVQGYGVEIAMLIDIVERYGADAIAQVDLGRRVHEHQPLDALGRMAGEILHVALSRLGAESRMVLTDPLGTTLLQPFRDRDGELAYAEAAVAWAERPPIRTLLAR